MQRRTTLLPKGKSHSRGWSGSFDSIFSDDKIAYPTMLYKMFFDAMFGGFPRDIVPSINSLQLPVMITEDTECFGYCRFLFHSLYHYLFIAGESFVIT
jgi:hypothetical protein